MSDAAFLIIRLVFIAAAILFWLLVFRIAATLIRLDPYHPLTQFLFRFTDYYVRPFRIGPLRRAARVDPAVWPPLAILAVVIIVCLMNL